MATVVDLNVQVGASASQLRSCPTATNSSTPIFAWTVPGTITQRRFNIRIQSEEVGQVGLFILGEQISADNQWQYPVGNPMTAQFIGLCSVEIAISASASSGAPFEYTSGKKYFVYDSVIEQFYNRSNVFCRWGNSFDPDVGQSVVYRLMVSEDPLFANPALSVFNGDVAQNSGGSTTSQQVGISLNKTYFWKVRANDGYDYGPFSPTHAFMNVDNRPPSVSITSIFVTENEFGDVYIYFDVDDPDGDIVHLEFQYTGGTAGSVKAQASLLNAVGNVGSGSHSVIWRSGRDEQLVSASNYVMYITAYDQVGPGTVAWYGPFALDNSAIGGDPGGIGSAELHFPVYGGMAKIISNDFETDQQPLTCALRETKGPYESVVYGLEGGLSSWLAYALKPISKRSFGNGSLIFSPAGTTIDYHRTLYGIDGLAIVDIDSYDPNLILTLDYVDSEGMYPEAGDRQYAIHGGRVGYVRFRRALMRDRSWCTSCGGKGWRVEELISLGGGRYQRQPCSVCGGSRFGSTKVGLSAYTVSDYKPVTDWFYPSDMDFLGAFPGHTAAVLFGSQFIWGSPHDSKDRWPVNPKLPERVHQRDGLMDNAKYNVVGQYPFLDLYAHMAKKTTSDYDDPWRLVPVTGGLYPEIQTTTPVTGPVEGNILHVYEEYSSGYSPSENPGFVNRDEPTHRWERGIWNFRGNIGSVRPLEPLRIVYLQAGWDIYNTIHWQASMSTVSRIHLQVAKFFGDGSHTDYVDVQTDDTEFYAAANAYLVTPNRWHTYWDVVRQQFLEEGYDYRLRIRQFDIQTNTSSQWVYSAKFSLNRHATNPANVTAVSYDPWRRWAHITFRLDDSQDDLYDIVRMWWSDDGSTFHEIGSSAILGNRVGLTSATGSNEHEIVWDISSFDLDPGDSYRVRIEVIPTKLTAGMSPPFIKWSSEFNPRLRKAEIQVMALTGQTQQYVYNPDTELFEHLDEPVTMPGQIDRLEAEKAAFRLSPPPSGMYQYVTPSGVVIDPSGYASWLSYEILPGISRHDIMIRQEQELVNLREVELPSWLAERDAAECAIRKGLIDQGFYCNGYVGNLQANGPFRFRVENMAYGSGVVDGEGNYVISYSDRYEVYYRIQMDFTSNFNSQTGGKPLRDFTVNKYGERIRGGNDGRTEYVLPDGTVQAFIDNTSYAWEGFGDGEGQPWDDGQRAGDPLHPLPEESAAATPPRVYGNFTIPRTDLPGLWTNKFVSNSYPSWTDTLPEGVESFDTNYAVRVAAYNLVSGSTVEQPFPLVTGISIQPSARKVTVAFTMYGDEAVSEGDISGCAYSLTTKTPVWEEDAEVSFPTDRPEGYEPSTADNPVIWVPPGKDRTRPCVIRTDDHQYLMWYGKESVYEEDVLVHARGKKATVLGEYSQSMPDRVVAQLSEYNGEQSIFAPCVIFDGGIYRMWTTMYNGTSTRIAYSTSADGDAWTVPQVITGIASGAYSPCVIRDTPSRLVMAYCKLDSGVSRIFMAESSDGMAFMAMNGGAAVIGGSDNLNTPCLLKVSGGYVIYFTRYASGTSTIRSMTSSNLTTWTSDREEVAGGAINPWVISDLHLGNWTYRMYYNKGGRIRSAVLVSRQWTSISLSAVNGNKTLVPCGRFGRTGSSVWINLDYGGLPAELRDVQSGADLKIRLAYANHASSRSYRVQSDWVDGYNAASLDAELDPATFRYNSEIQYLNFGDDF